MSEPKQVSTDTVLFCTMVLPSLLLLAAFVVGMAVLVATVGDDYVSPVTTTEECDAHP